MSTQKLLGALVVTLLVSIVTNCMPQPTPTPPPPTVAPTPTDSTVIVLATGEFAPYTSSSLEGYGAMTAVVSAVIAEMGLTPEYVFYPWKRAEDEVRKGHAFAAFPYKMTDERAQEFDFSDPLYVVKARFFYHRKYYPHGIAYEKLEDLQGYVIGGVLGNWYETPFKEAGLAVEYVGTLDQNFGKLYLGRVDLVAEEENACWASIRKLYPDEVDQFAGIEKTLDENELRLMVSRDYPHSAELLEQFNTALATIKDKGIYQRILEEYQLAVE